MCVVRTSMYNQFECMFAFMALNKTCKLMIHICIYALLILYLIAINANDEDEILQYLELGRARMEQNFYLFLVD